MIAGTAQSCRIARATPAHAGVISALHMASFETGWNEQSCRTLLMQPAHFGLLALSGAAAQAVPSGFILASRAAALAEILTLGATPEHRRHKVGSALVAGAIDICRKAGADRLFLEVDAGDDAALDFYRGLGFTRAGVRPRYYKRRSGGRADALIMHKQIG
jgi:ribosomal-protein-alanine N-acetyltransferase